MTWRCHEYGLHFLGLLGALLSDPSPKFALLSGEAPQDVAPAGIDPAVTVTSDLGPRPLHRFALIYLGMPLFDNLDLEALGDVAASLSRWEFLLTAAPLPTRGTGSPINPIATF